MNFIFDDDMIWILFLLVIVFFLPQKCCKNTNGSELQCEKSRDIIYRSQRRKKKKQESSGLDY